METKVCADGSQVVFGAQSAAPVPYSRHEYKETEKGSYVSAKETITHLFQWFRPQSVVDVGCGVGAWLSAFKDAGVTDVFGIDGDHVNPTWLHIPPERFLSKDLTQPFSLDRSFDLVVSVEVAEHLPASSAAHFVDSLVALGPVILFSAAIPFQGGYLHVNEQWPVYWAKLFRERGFLAVDCLRAKVWNSEDVKWWYAQNIVVFVKQAEATRYSTLIEAGSGVVDFPHSLVHPKLYLQTLENGDVDRHSTRRILLLAAMALRKAFIRRSSRWGLRLPFRSKVRGK